jgi:hypothetical protein
MRILTIHTMAVLGLLCLPWAAHADGKWSVGIRFGAPVYHRPYPYYGGYYYYRPYPVYVAPAPVVVQQIPVAQPVYATPLPAPTPIPNYSAAPTEPPQDQVEQYLRQMASTDEHARAGAMVQLGRMKVQRAVEPIGQALASDRSPAVREAAARALGLIGSPASLPALQRAAQADDDREVRHSAQFAAEVIRANLPR